MEKVHALDDEVAAEDRLDIYFNVIDRVFRGGMRRSATTHGG